MSQISLEIIIIFILLLGNGILAMAEMSLVSSRKARLKALADAGSRPAAAALALTAAPNQFLSTVQIGITLVGILAGAFGGARIAEWIASRFIDAGLTTTYAQNISLAIVVLTITYFSLVIGELVPKRLALSAPERFACFLAIPMRALAVVARPAVKVLSVSTDLALRLLGVRPESATPVSADEVRVLMQEGQQAGVFHQAEPEMVQRVLELDEVLVKEIMTPRPKVIFVHRDEPHDRVWHKIVANGHSQYPVYETNRDEVIGVVSVKSIYANLAASAPVQLADLMIKPLFVPTTQTAVRLLETFRQSRMHFAVAVDEFGSVAGVVTLVDVLEAIVGDVPSQEERMRPEIRPRPDGTWLIDGGIDVESVEDTLAGLRFPPYDDRGYQTLAGFVMDHLGRVPAEGDIFEALGWHYEIIDMDGPRIDKILAQPIPPGDRAVPHAAPVA
jgi:putative hemolysin